MTADLAYGAEGAEVRTLQMQLLALGYHLPRWGADGVLGDETLMAVAALRHDRNLGTIGDEIPRTVPGDIRDAIKKLYDEAALVPVVPVVRDLRAAHLGDQQRGIRPWSAVTGIMLHQTAGLIGETPAHWFHIACHIGITRGGQILVLNALDTVIWHGNSLNRSDIGVEIDGYFEGIEGKPGTLWRPPNKPDLVALTPSAVQLEACRVAVKWIVGEVASAGGSIGFIHAHRQASNQRQSDPGSRIWQEIGLWAREDLGLSDGGKDFAVGSGLRIPEAWDPERTGIAY